MEFKFPAVHNTTSTTTPTPTSLSTITTTSLSHPTLPPRSSTMVPTPNLSEMMSSNNALEALQRELEKEEIRREIMRGMITRREVLEKEVWREIMLAMHSNLDMMLTHDPFPNIFSVPQQQQSEKTQPAPQNKDKLIILAKPDPDLYASKRKAVTPAVEKNSKEWSCALCQLNIASEKTLNQHLQGRKHKAKEAALGFEMIGLDTKADMQSLQPTVSCEGLNEEQSNETVLDEGLLDFKNEEQLEQINKNAKDSKKQNGTATWEEVQKINALKRRKIDLWCEICQVRTNSQIVMESHKKGRKHLTRMKKLDQKDRSASLISSTASLETTGLIRDEDAVNLNRPRDDMCSEQGTIKMAESFAKSDKSALSPWLNKWR